MEPAFNSRLRGEAHAAAAQVETLGRREKPGSAMLLILCILVTIRLSANTVRACSGRYRHRGAGPHTIAFASSLLGQTLVVGPNEFQLMQSDVAIVGPCYLDGRPGITMDGTSVAGYMLYIPVSNVSISHIRFIRIGLSAIATFAGATGASPAPHYDAYAASNIDVCASLTLGTAHRPGVLALSSGFMTYREDIHPAYASIRRDLANDSLSFVLLPSLELEDCVAEIVRRQIGRPFSRSAEREEQVIRTRFALYRNLATQKVETIRPAAEVVDELLKAIAAQPEPTFDGCRARQ